MYTFLQRDNYFLNIYLLLILKIEEKKDCSLNVSSLLLYHPMGMEIILLFQSFHSLSLHPFIQLSIHPFPSFLLLCMHKDICIVYYLLHI